MNGQHDLADRRWLSPAHRDALDAGTLLLPESSPSQHTAVLVSVPANHEGTPVAWVDCGVAEIVFYAAMLGAPTAESCENAGGNDGHYGWPPNMAMLWFNNQAELDRFASLLDQDVSDGLLWFEPRRWFPRKRDRIFAVAIPPRRSCGLVAHLYMQLPPCMCARTRLDEIMEDS